MSKISKNIKMFDILSSGRKYTCKQLAEMLEISPRMVRLYKDEIEYILLHQFCHLKFKTHSKKFYELISKYNKNFEEYEKRLKKYII